MQKKHRLKKNWEFQEIINSKKQYVSNFLIFYYRKNNGEDGVKIGISIPKKFANAVGRNKYRRQVKSILDIIKPWDVNYDVVIILRKSFLDRSFEKKTKEVKKMFERLINGK